MASIPEANPDLESFLLNLKFLRRNFSEKNFREVG
jgi:hypothetical protein